MRLTFCFGLTRANTRIWGKKVWSSRGSQLILASPSPVTHKSNSCTNEEMEGGDRGMCTLPSIDSHCHTPGKYQIHDSPICLLCNQTTKEKHTRYNSVSKSDYSPWLCCNTSVCSFWMKWSSLATWHAVKGLSPVIITTWKQREISYPY